MGWFGLLSSSTMTMPSIFLPSIIARIAGRLTLPSTERAVAEERLAAAEVLQVHVMDDRQEVLDDLHRVGAALLELADVGPELHVPGVDGSP